jgi:hypothetical protein
MRNWIKDKIEDVVDWTLLSHKRFWTILSWVLVGSTVLVSATAIFPTREGIELGLLNLFIVIVLRYVSILCGISRNHHKSIFHQDQYDSVIHRAGLA